MKVETNYFNEAFFIDLLKCFFVVKISFFGSEIMKHFKDPENFFLALMNKIYAVYSYQILTEKRNISISNHIELVTEMWFL